MKNHDEMYQSVLSRFDEYQKQKKKRFRIIKLAAPAVACFGLAIAFGIGYYAKFAKMPEIPVAPLVSEVSVTEAAETTVSSITDSSTVSPSYTSKKAKTNKKTVPTTVSGHEERTASQKVYPPQLAVTTAPNDSSESKTVHTAVSQTKKTSSVTTAKQTTKRTAAGTTVHTTVSEQDTDARTTVTTVTTTDIVAPEPETMPETITEPPQPEIVLEDADGKFKVLYSKDSNIDLKRFKVMSNDTYEIYNSNSNAEPPDGNSDGNNSSNDLFTMDKQEALRRIELMERLTIGEYLRARAVVNGELSADAPRLTIEQTNEIIAGSDSFNEIYQKLQAAQPIPDYVGGSGVSKVEYWFDNMGTEKIMLILEQEDVVYVHLNKYDWIVR